MEKNTRTSSCLSRAQAVQTLPPPLPPLAVLMPWTGGNCTILDKRKYAEWQAKYDIKEKPPKATPRLPLRLAIRDKEPKGPAGRGLGATQPAWQKQDRIRSRSPPRIPNHVTIERSHQQVHRIDPLALNFSYKEVDAHFDNYSVEELIEDALMPMAPSPVLTFPPFQVFEAGDRLYALDNERLLVARVLRYKGYCSFVRYYMLPTDDQVVSNTMRAKWRSTCNDWFAAVTSMGDHGLAPKLNGDCVHYNEALAEMGEMQRDIRTFLYEFVNTIDQDYPNFQTEEGLTALIQGLSTNGFDTYDSLHRLDAGTLMAIPVCAQYVGFHKMLLQALRHPDACLHRHILEMEGQWKSKFEGPYYVSGSDVKGPLDKQFKLYCGEGKGGVLKMATLDRTKEWRVQIDSRDNDGRAMRVHFADGSEDRWERVYDTTESPRRRPQPLAGPPPQKQQRNEKDTHIVDQTWTTKDEHDEGDQDNDVDSGTDDNERSEAFETNNPMGHWRLPVLRKTRTKKHAKNHLAITNYSEADRCMHGHNHRQGRAIFRTKKATNHPKKYGAWNYELQPNTSYSRTERFIHGHSHRQARAIPQNSKAQKTRTPEGLHQAADAPLAPNTTLPAEQNDKYIQHVHIHYVKPSMGLSTPLGATTKHGQQWLPPKPPQNPGHQDKMPPNAGVSTDAVVPAAGWQGGGGGMDGDKPRYFGELFDAEGNCVGYRHPRRRQMSMEEKQADNRRRVDQRKRMAVRETAEMEAAWEEELQAPSAGALVAADKATARSSDTSESVVAPVLQCTTNPKSLPQEFNAKLWARPGLVARRWWRYGNANARLPRKRLQETSEVESETVATRLIHEASEAETNEWPEDVTSEAQRHAQPKFMLSSTDGDQDQMQMDAWNHGAAEQEQWQVQQTSSEHAPWLNIRTEPTKTRAIDVPLHLRWPKAIHPTPNYSNRSYSSNLSQESYTVYCKIYCTSQSRLWWWASHFGEVLWVKLTGNTGGTVMFANPDSAHDAIRSSCEHDPRSYMDHRWVHVMPHSYGYTLGQQRPSSSGQA